MLPQMKMNTTSDYLPQHDRQLLPHSKEAEWAVSGAVFGLTAAFIQILVRSLVFKRRDVVDRVDRVDMGGGEGWEERGDKFMDNYISHWARPPAVPKGGRVGHRLRNHQTKKGRRRNKFRLNYVKNWDRAPVLIMNDIDRVSEHEKYLVKEYIKNKIFPLLSSSKQFKYDLKKLNTDFHTTTSDPWNDLMSVDEYLPNSFAENMLSSLTVKNKEQSVNVEHNEKLNMHNIGEKEQNKVINEYQNMNQNMIENPKEIYNPPINSYVG